MTQASLTKQLYRLVVGTGKGSIGDKFDDLVASLKNTDALLIVDEAETLTPNQLHTIRRVRDLAGIGIVLAGTEHLSGLIKPQHGQFDQIRSRPGFWPGTVTGISAEDAAALVQSACGAEEVADEVIARLYAYCKGSARMLVEGLIAGIKEFRRGRALDPRRDRSRARHDLLDLRQSAFVREFAGWVGSPRRQPLLGSGSTRCRWGSGPQYLVGSHSCFFSSGDCYPLGSLHLFSSPYQPVETT